MYIHIYQVHGWLGESPVIYLDCVGEVRADRGFLRFKANTDRHRFLLPFFSNRGSGDMHAFDFYLVWLEVRKQAGQQLTAWEAAANAKAAPT